MGPLTNSHARARMSGAQDRSFPRLGAAGRPGGRPAARPNTRGSLPCLGARQTARAAARGGRDSEVQ